MYPSHISQIIFYLFQTRVTAAVFHEYGQWLPLKDAQLKSAQSYQSSALEADKSYPAQPIF